MRSYMLQDCPLATRAADICIRTPKELLECEPGASPLWLVMLCGTLDLKERRYSSIDPTIDVSKETSGPEVRDRQHGRYQKWGNLSMGDLEDSEVFVVEGTGNLWEDLLASSHNHRKLTGKKKKKRFHPQWIGPRWSCLMRPWAENPVKHAGIPTFLHFYELVSECCLKWLSFEELVICNRNEYDALFVVTCDNFHLFFCAAN